MIANAQFCWSGDNTVEALQSSITSMKKNASEFDQNIAILISDANLDRYAIKPDHLKPFLEKEGNVSGYVIFIGSLGNEAEQLVMQLPKGRAFYVEEPSRLPGVFNQIFTTDIVQ